ALPAPDRAEQRISSSPPQGPYEQLVAQVWCSLLGRSSVGREDDFFALGGHSLLATQVLSRLRNVLAVEVPLREAFSHRTVASLGAVLQAAAAKGQAALSDR